MFFKPIITEHFKEVSRKNIFYRYYLVTSKMTFNTFVLGYEAEIRRKSDGLLLAKLHKNGLLEIFPGYYSDGPSGPTIDTVAFVYGSMPHDVFYQMLRENLLIKPEEFNYNMPVFYDRFRQLRLCADEVMLHINKKYGMWFPRTSYTYRSVRLAGEKHALPIELKDWLGNN